jgi:GDP-4-dehydro-6-deoxy-D-mannose reductase
MPRLLITGSSGFVGTALRHYLADTPWGERVIPCEPADAFDITRPDEVDALVASTRPDWVLHLAAQSHVQTSFGDPAGTFEVNLIGTLNLLQALSRAGFAGRLLYVSSADIYGQVDEADLPIVETQASVPRSPYAVSKAATEMLCWQWRLTYGIDIVIARPFNHAGAGQSPDFALSGFAQSIAAIALGRQEPRILTGDLDVTRDFTDVRDIMEAYLALLERGRAGEAYNVCSGREFRLADLLQDMLDRAGVRAEVSIEPSRMRPVDQRRVYGNHGKLTAHTGWQPRIPIGDTLDGLIRYWKKEWQS